MGNIDVTLSQANEVFTGGDYHYTAHAAMGSNGPIKNVAESASMTVAEVIAALNGSNLNGTANQVTVTQEVDGSITMSLPSAVVVDTIKAKRIQVPNVPTVNALSGFTVTTPPAANINSFEYTEFVVNATAASMLVEIDYPNAFAGTTQIARVFVIDQSNFSTVCPNTTVNTAGKSVTFLTPATSGHDYKIIVLGVAF